MYENYVELCTCTTPALHTHYSYGGVPSVTAPMLFFSVNSHGNPVSHLDLYRATCVVASLLPVSLFLFGEKKFLLVSVLIIIVIIPFTIPLCLCEYM